MERYRGHLILVKAHQEPDTDDWSATTHIQFNEDNLTFRDVQLPGPASYFQTKTATEKQDLKKLRYGLMSGLIKLKYLCGRLFGGVLLGVRMDAPARKFHDTHDMNVKEVPHEAGASRESTWSGCSIPAKKQRDGSDRQLAYPANAETRMLFQRMILAEY